MGFIRQTQADEPQPQANQSVSGGVPAWAADAIWYQVFVSRFANGEPANDPGGTLAWTREWEQFQSGEEGTLRSQLLDRRYGGDLQGLQDKLDYLANLGVNAIYLNPVFQANTQHKYDTSDHRHIDDSFGFMDSRLKLSGETQDPATWKFSESDRLFLDLLKNAHARGIRVMIDGVFNHVGQSFWAWEDVKKNGRDSRYANWFAVTAWEPKLQWDAWDGPNGRLVNFRQVADRLDPEVEQYLFACVRRWMDPNGDGDPADGVDGWRLDAAERVPHGFWHAARSSSRAEPRCIDCRRDLDRSCPLDGRNTVRCCHELPGGLCDPGLGWGEGRQTTHAASMTAWGDRMLELNRRFSPSINRSMLNLLDSHDTARAITQLTHHKEGELNHNASSPAPDESAIDAFKLAVCLQFALPGAPMIYNGDELGMYGKNDPFCRAPMWWHDVEAPTQPNKWLAYYKQLAQLQANNSRNCRGDLQVIRADNQTRTIVISRQDSSNRSLLLINADNVGHEVEFVTKRDSEWLELFHTGRPESYSVKGKGSMRLRADKQGRVTVSCNPLSGVLLREVRNNSSSES
ncbi:MAG: alpha-amylase family glycosyl hydrolase [Phycisphaerae bacterium]